MTEALTGGLEDAAREAAHAFRAAMQVMARPGRIDRLAGAAPPAPLSVAAGTLILTLCDATTPLHLAGRTDCAEVRAWVAFHTGVPLAGPADCTFAVGRWADLVPLGDYPVGSAEYPDRSATLIVEMDALSATGTRLTGPGIRDAAHLDLPDAEAMRPNARGFPLGLDFFLTAGDRVAALPRSTRIG